MDKDMKNTVDILRFCSGDGECDECVLRDYDGCMAKVRTDAADLIERLSAELEKTKTKMAHKNRKLIHKNAKLARLERSARQENAELLDQVYILKLYLHRAIITGNRLVGDSTFGDVLEEGYDGMPGYNPAILEVRNGAND